VTLRVTEIVDFKRQGRTIMQVKDVMTRNVISVQANESVISAARLMLQNSISGLPVIDREGELVGIVSEGDFLRRGRARHAAPSAEMARIHRWAGKARRRICAHRRQEDRRDHDT
jgi:CBS-domain-containing membrane protein